MKENCNVSAGFTPTPSYMFRNRYLLAWGGGWHDHDISTFLVQLLAIGSLIAKCPRLVAA